MKEDNWTTTTMAPDSTTVTTVAEKIRDGRTSGSLRYQILPMMRAVTSAFVPKGSARAALTILAIKNSLGGVTAAFTSSTLMLDERPRAENAHAWERYGGVIKPDHGTELTQ